ncbi:hypothetical protein D3C72_2061140 [compost metagenome]
MGSDGVHLVDMLQQARRGNLVAQHDYAVIDRKIRKIPALGAAADLRVGLDVKRGMGVVPTSRCDHFNEGRGVS